MGGAARREPSSEKPLSGGAGGRESGKVARPESHWRLEAGGRRGGQEAGHGGDFTASCQGPASPRDLLGFCPQSCDADLAWWSRARALGVNCDLVESGVGPSGGFLRVKPISQASGAGLSPACSAAPGTVRAPSASTSAGPWACGSPSAPALGQVSTVPPSDQTAPPLG